MTSESARVLAAAEAALVALAQPAAAARGEVAPAPGGAPAPVDAETARLALAATAAVSSRFLAVGTPRSIGLVGGGPLARDLLALHRVLFAPREVRCAGADPAEAARLAAEVGGRVTSIAEACACDIVCALASARPIARAWIRGGTHLVAAGATLEPALLAAAKVVGDGPAPPGTHMWGTLAAIAAGHQDGRELDEISIYLATPLAHVEEMVARCGTRGAQLRQVPPEDDLQG
jgi:ornithine cyclodeaminase/alanine dehydrogenase-like protein (mu-crystallin family)